MTYKAIFHVDQNEEPVMNLALNNVVKPAQCYSRAGA